MLPFNTSQFVFALIFSFIGSLDSNQTANASANLTQLNCCAFNTNPNNTSQNQQPEYLVKDIFKLVVVAESDSARKVREIDFDSIIDAIQQSRPNRNVSHVALVFAASDNRRLPQAKQVWSVNALLRRLQSSGKVVLLRRLQLANNCNADDVVGQMDACDSVKNVGEYSKNSDADERQQYPASDGDEVNGDDKERNRDNANENTNCILDETDSTR